MRFKANDEVRSKNLNNRKVIKKFAYQINPLLDCLTQHLGFSIKKEKNVLRFEGYFSHNWQIKK